jgi:hypothetical protein
MVFDRKIPKKRFYLITAAQNATPVHKGALLAMEAFARHHDAEIIVLPIRYKNPTSTFNDSQENAEVWDPRVQKYLSSMRTRLNKNLVILGDVKTQPTASSPLTGYDAITGGESAILGHTKLQLRSIATPQNSMAKILTTTGAITVPNYTDSKAGALGEFHHCLGAALVEIDGKRFHLRQINCRRDGSFIDLDKMYSRFGVSDAPRASAIIMGDVHVDYADPAAVKATFQGPDSMIGVLRPKYVVYHDLSDEYATNPHHYGNPFNFMAKRRGGKHLVREEIERACQFVIDNTPKDSIAVIVPSNHNDFLERWMKSHDWKSDPDNAEFYLETALHMARSAKMGLGGAEYLNPFEYWVRKFFKGHKNVIILKRDESFIVDGIELGFHSDKGPNGSRGNIKNFRRLGVKTVIGHGHSEGIDEGSTQVGTLTYLRLEYNSGPSSWTQSNCVIYKGGKRSLLNIVKGDWRGRG